MKNLQEKIAQASGHEGMSADKYLQFASAQLVFSNDLDGTLLINHSEINPDNVLLILWCQAIGIPVSLTTYRDYGSSATEYAAAILAGKDPEKTTLRYILSQLAHYAVDIDDLALCTRNEPLSPGVSRHLAENLEPSWASQAKARFENSCSWFDKEAFCKRLQAAVELDDNVKETVEDFVSRATITNYNPRELVQALLGCIDNIEQQTALRSLFKHYFADLMVKALDIKSTNEVDLILQTDAGKQYAKDNDVGRKYLQTEYLVKASKRMYVVHLDDQLKNFNVFTQYLQEKASTIYPVRYDAEDQQNLWLLEAGRVTGLHGYALNMLEHNTQVQTQNVSKAFIAMLYLFSIRQHLPNESASLLQGKFEGLKETHYTQLPIGIKRLVEAMSADNQQFNQIQANPAEVANIS